jgi:hypothetical protein
MWRPSEDILIKFHVVGSLATLSSAACLIVICFSPSAFPGVYRLLADDRIAFIIPYLLFIALAEAFFSLWYFLFRK